MVSGAAALVGHIPMPLLFISSDAFGIFPYDRSLFLRGFSNDTRRVTTLPISKLAVLAGAQLLLYATEGAAPDYSVGSLCFNHVGGGMFFRLPTLFGMLSASSGFTDLLEGCARIRLLLSYRFIV